MITSNINHYNLIAYEKLPSEESDSFTKDSSFSFLNSFKEVELPIELKRKLSLRNKNGEAAYTYYDDFFWNEPKSKEAGLGLAKAYSLLGNEENSLAVYEYLFTLYPQSPDLLLARAKCYNKFQQHFKALQDVYTIEKLYPGHLEAKLLAIKILFEQSFNTHLEVAQLAEIHNQNPMNLKIWKFIVYSNFCLGHLEEAKKGCATINQHYGESSGIHFLLSKIYFASKDKINSFVHLQRALKLQKNKIKGLREKVIYHIFLNEPKEAKEALNKMMAMNNDHMVTWSTRVFYHSWNKEYSKAIQIATDAIRKFPTNLKFLFYRSNCFSESKQWRHSFFDADKVIHDNPSHMGALKIKEKLTKEIPHHVYIKL